MKVRNYQKPMSALRLFDDFFNRSVQDFFDRDFLNGDQPSVNVIEKEDKYLVEVAAPGMKKEHFDVQVENGLLRIKAEAEHKKEEEEENYMRREFSYQSFERSFVLPEHIDSEAMEANYEDGVLTVSLPKKEVTVAKRKMIEVK